MEKVFMKQVHSTTIAIISEETKLEPRSMVKGYDGLITKRKETALISYGADCCLVAFWDSDTIGICHAGWRGFVSGMFDKMLVHFKKKPMCIVAPFLHSFEILKDDCYDRIQKRFGGEYLEEDEKIIFNFKQAVLDTLQEKTLLVLDDRSTINHSELASWRRDRKKGRGTQNRFAVWKDQQGTPRIKLFLPGEDLVF